MGMSAGRPAGRGGRGHRRRGRHHGLMSEINVTPFVDVMLVLLIIFMVAAPLLTVGVPIDLPETQAKAMNSETQPITISVNEEGQIYLQETEIPLDEVVPKLQRDRHGRLRGAHLCARRQDGRLRHRDAGHGAHLRLPATAISASSRLQEQDDYPEHEDRPHDIGGAACGAARLRADLAVGAEGRSRSPTWSRCRSTSCRWNRSPRSSRATRRRRVNEKPAPKPTEQAETRARRPEGRREQASTPTSRRRPRPRQSRSRPRRCPKPAPKPEPKPVEQAEARSGQRARTEAGAVPATEVTPQPQPKQEVKPDPVSEAIAADETPRRTRSSCRRKRPRPSAKPQPPKAADREDAGPQGSREAGQASCRQAEIRGEGIRRRRGGRPSQQGEGFGRRRQALDRDGVARRRQDDRRLPSCRKARWTRCAARCSAAGTFRPAHADAGNLRVSVQFKLDRRARWKAARRSSRGGGSAGVERAAAEAARRAVSRCAPYNLPAEKYEAWAEVIVNFDPSEMF